jgi:hypothetical protein
MAEEMKGRVVGGEVDGGYFGGYVKPANQKEYRPDRRFARNQNGKRKVVVVIRERGGNSVPAVFNTESQALHSSVPESISAACAGLQLAFTTISLEHTCSDMRRSPHGVRTIAE